MESILKMRILWVVLLFASLFSVDSTFILAANASNKINDTILLAGRGTSTYDRFMRLGYGAAGRRQYRRAKNYFRRALRYRPEDRYARRAIANMNRYIALISHPSIPGVGKTPRRTSAGVRYAIRRGRRRSSYTCKKNKEAAKSLIPLIPSDADSVTTTAEYPSLFFYIPQIPKAKVFQLVVRNSEGENLQEISLKPKEQSGIVRVNLTSTAGKPLELNQKYTWAFYVIFDTKNRDTDWILEGSIQRIQPNEYLNFDLKTAAPQEQVEIYLKNNLWEDALRTLADLRSQNPNDTEINQYWQELLKSLELQDEIIQAPLLQSSQADSENLAAPKSCRLVGGATR